jgi:hypothetical protein
MKILCGQESVLHCGVQVQMYDSCGGRSSKAGVNAPDPEVCCPEGSLCKFYTEDFWQCQPKTYNAPPEPPMTHDDAACAGKTKVQPLQNISCKIVHWLTEPKVRE